MDKHPFQQQRQLLREFREAVTTWQQQEQEADRRWQTGQQDVDRTLKQTLEQAKRYRDQEEGRITQKYQAALRTAEDARVAKRAQAERLLKETESETRSRYREERKQADTLLEQVKEKARKSQEEEIARAQKRYEEMVKAAEEAWAQAQKLAADGQAKSQAHLRQCFSYLTRAGLSTALIPAEIPPVSPKGITENDDPTRMLEQSLDAVLRARLAISDAVDELLRWRETWRRRRNWAIGIAVTAALVTMLGLSIRSAQVQEMARQATATAFHPTYVVMATATAQAQATATVQAHATAIVQAWATATAQAQATATTQARATARAQAHAMEIVFVTGFQGEGVYAIKINKGKITEQTTTSLYNNCGMAWNKVRQEIYVSGCNGDVIPVIKINPLREIAVISENVGWNADQILVSPDGKTLYGAFTSRSTSRNNTGSFRRIVAFNTATRRSIGLIQLDHSYDTAFNGISMVMSPDGNKLYVSWDANLDTYALPNMSLIRRDVNSGWETGALVTSMDGKFLFIIQGNTLIKWNTDKHAIENQVTIPREGKGELQISNDGQKLWICDWEAKAIHEFLASFTDYRLMELSEQPEACAPSIDNTFLYVITEKDTLLVIDLYTGSVTQRISGVSNGVGIMAISP